MTIERQYLCSLPPDEHETEVYAATAPKARYRYWLSVRESWDVPLIAIRVRAGEPPSPPSREWERLGLTERQRDLARHALGLDGRHKQSYRNHYATGPGSDGYQEWLDLEAKGLAKRRTSQMCGGNDVFHCSQRLALAVRGSYERLDPEVQP